MRGAAEFDDAGFEAATTAGAVLVCFHDDSGEFAPVVRRAAYALARVLSDGAVVALAGRAKCPSAFRRHRVLTVPTYILFRDGRTVVTAVGYQREDDLLKIVGRHLGTD